MNLDRIRALCLSLPHATEGIQWEDHLLFRVGGRMFVVLDLDPPHLLSFKCTPEDFAELTQRPGLIPAPYMARNHWVKVQEEDALRFSELEPLIRKSYALIYEKLSKKLKRELEEGVKEKRADPKIRPRKSR